MMIASTARISNIFVADMPKNIRLTGFGVSAFEVESVTRKREAHATQAQEAFGTSQRPSMYTSHGCNTPNFLAFPEAGADLLFGLALLLDFLSSKTNESLDGGLLFPR